MTKQEGTNTMSKEGKHTEELKSCPFCGGKAIALPAGTGGNGLMIECMSNKPCPHPHVSYYDHEQSIAVWNTRTESGLVKELVEALAGLVGTIEKDAKVNEANYAQIVIDEPVVLQAKQVLAKYSLTGQEPKAGSV